MLAYVFQTMHKLKKFRLGIHKQNLGYYTLFEKKRIISYKISSRVLFYLIKEIEEFIKLQFVNKTN